MSTDTHSHPILVIECVTNLALILCYKSICSIIYLHEYWIKEQKKKNEWSVSTVDDIGSSAHHTNSF